MVTQLICEARESRGNLAVLWLDLAYRSIPHKLVELALSRFHVPEKIPTNLSLRESSGRSTLDWHRLEKGITDCTISASLFALAMNVLAKSVEVECKGSLLRAFVNLALDNP